MRRRGLEKLWPLLEGRHFSSVIQAGVGPGREVERLHEITQAPFFGFEPNVDYFEKWQHKYPGKLFNSPLWDKCEPVEFHVTEKGHSSSIYEREGTKKVITLQAITLDFAADVMKLDFGDSILLWMDAEFAELNILRGAASIIPRVTFCVCEFFHRPEEQIVSGRSASWNSWPPKEETRNLIISHGLKPLAMLDDNDLACDEAFCRANS